MTPIIYDHPLPRDIDAVMNIENSCFTPDEAATRESMIERILLIPDTFLVARVMPAGRPIGMIVGPVSENRYITDNIFERTRENSAKDKTQMIVSLAVLKEFRQYGIASELLKKLTEIDRAARRELISLTCLESLIGYYEGQGFTNEGISASQHAGETWYNMIYKIR